MTEQETFEVAQSSMLFESTSQPQENIRKQSSTPAKNFRRAPSFQTPNVRSESPKKALFQTNKTPSGFKRNQKTPSSAKRWRAPESAATPPSHFIGYATPHSAKSRKGSFEIDLRTPERAAWQLERGPETPICRYDSAFLMEFSTLCTASPGNLDPDVFEPWTGSVDELEQQLKALILESQVDANADAVAALVDADDAVLVPSSENASSAAAASPVSKSPRLIETDEARLRSRQKQLDIGFRTSGYKVYSELRASGQTKDLRVIPKTPNKVQVCSKRSWDAQVRKWRRELHLFDDINENNESDQVDVSGSQFDSPDDAVC